MFQANFYLPMIKAEELARGVMDVKTSCWAEVCALRESYYLYGGVYVNV